MDSSGHHVWSRCFGGEGERTFGPEVAVAPDGSIFLVGTLFTVLDFAVPSSAAMVGAGALRTEGEGDIYVVKLTEDGEFEWQRRFGDAESQDTRIGVVATEDRSVILAGTTRGKIDLDSGGSLPGDPNGMPFFLELDDTGHVRWGAPLGASAYMTAYDAVALGDCNTFYFAADYHGDLTARSEFGGTSGLVVGRFAR